MTNVLERVMKLIMCSIAHSNDRILELTLGSRLAIRVIFAVMSRQFVPSAAEGFEGSICYELRRHNGAIIEGWALRITASAAKASFGFPSDPAVTLKLTVGDFVRFNLGAVSPVTLLTEERLKLDGDLTSPPSSPRCSDDPYLSPDSVRCARLGTGRLTHPRSSLSVSAPHLSGTFQTRASRNAPHSSPWGSPTRAPRGHRSLAPRSRAVPRTAAIPPMAAWLRSRDPCATKRDRTAAPCPTIALISYRARDARLL